MKIIVITGTPGTGKSTLAKKIKGKLIDVTKIVKENKLCNEYDKKKQCYVMDVDILNKLLIEIIEKEKKRGTKKLIMDSHLSHYLPKKYVNLCIITKCELKILKKRLEKRKYSKEKVRENLDCEIFDICLNEAKEAGHKVTVIDTSKGISTTAVRKLLNTI